MAGDFNPGNLLKQFKQMQEQMKTTQKELEAELITSDVRGGAIKVTVTGTQTVKSIDIAPDLLEKIDAVELEKLLISVINKALDKARKAALSKLGPLGGGLGGLK